MGGGGHVAAGGRQCSACADTCPKLADTSAAVTPSAAGPGDERQPRALHYISEADAGKPWRAVPGIEPETSRTLSENHATRPNSQVSIKYILCLLVVCLFPLKDALVS